MLMYFLLIKLWELLHAEIYMSHTVACLVHRAFK